MDTAVERPLTTRLAWWGVLWTALTVLAFASQAVKMKPQRVPLFFQYSLGIGSFVQYGIILLVLLGIAFGLPRQRSLFGLRPPRSVRRAAGIGVLVLIAIYAVSAVVGSFLKPGKEQGILPEHGWVGGHVGAFVLSLIAVSVVAPIVEELMFRGLGFALLRPFGEWPAIVIVGIAFGVYHGIPDALPILVPFGAALAYLRSRTDSVFPGMVVHALFNTAAVLYAVA